MQELFLVDDPAGNEISCSFGPCTDEGCADTLELFWVLWDPVLTSPAERPLCFSSVLLEHFKDWFGLRGPKKSTWQGEDILNWLVGNLADPCGDVGLGLDKGCVCSLLPPPGPGPGGTTPFEADDTAAAAARCARASWALALISAKVRAPVRPGLLSGPGRGVLGEI